MSTASLRAQLGSALVNVGRRVCSTLSTGISSLDDLTGGLPRGAITEVYGPPSTGRTSIAFAILAAATAQDEVCAFIDGHDAFNPASGSSAGIDLQRLLWVRCHDIDQVLRSTDLLLQGGGFGLAVMDFSDLPATAIRAIPLGAWFRFQRVIEKSPTVLLLIGTESIAKSAASLVLQTGQSHVDWRGNLLAGNELRIEIPRVRNPKSGIRTPKFIHHVSCYSRP